ncbi:MAG TPA: hypothetical protein VIE43_23535 [Thermoanaerobaculia bacterium]|jgi:hypothetical protein|nr:hypothetical protein [Thermoanaerobaculia bacterium]
MFTRFVNSLFGNVLCKAEDGFFQDTLSHVIMKKNRCRVLVTLLGGFLDHDSASVWIKLFDIAEFSILIDSRLTLAATHLLRREGININRHLLPAFRSNAALKAKTGDRARLVVSLVL